MKFLSKIIITIIFLSLFNQTFSELNRTEKTGYELFKHRTELVCNKYKKNNPLYQTRQYKDYKGEKIYENTITLNDLDDAKSLYRNNMNNIYKCALIGVKLNSYDKILNSIITNNAELKTKIGTKLQNEKNKLNLEAKALKCRNTKKIDSFNIKKQVLDQTTFELCKYNFYLEYLKEKNENNILGDIRKEDLNNSSIGVNTVIEKYNKKVNLIDQEIENSYDVYPIAFKAYTDYENSITTHLLLEIIKHDYALLRDNLHKSLGPINQVVYKISNAMKP